MKNLRNLIFYIAVIGGFVVVIYSVISAGASLELGRPVKHAADHVSASTWHQFTETFMHNLQHPLAMLLLQILTIIIAARILGFFCKKIGQPSVIGEIVAGVILGPSVLGNPIFAHLGFNEVSAFLFPQPAKGEPPLPWLGNLQFLSQIGLILFMFVVGMELDLKTLKNKANDAIVISHASIVFPFALGVGLAFFLYQTYSPEGINFLSFALFIGISMSITAFPVLARIVQERGLMKTRLGAVVITCAAADDISAWCILAAVIAIVKAGSVLSALYIILIAVVYVLFMLKIVAPFLKRLGDKHSNKESLSKPVVALFFITLILSSYATEVIGIHALFGAFMAGVIMPVNLNFRNVFIEKVEDVSVLLLLPLFFVFTGLRTKIGLLNDWNAWGITAIVIAIATTGKFLGSALAARFTGHPWKESLIIGSLMNTRGLMELIVLNIGLDLGVLSEEMFAMLVIMALVTTFMTGPIIDFLHWLVPDKQPEVASHPTSPSHYSILVAFGSPDRGRTMVRLADSFVRKNAENATITALHVSLSNDLNQFNIDEYEKESFRPVRLEAKKLETHVETMFKATVDIDKEVTDTANGGNFDLLLIGIGRSVFEGSLLGRVLGFTNKLINPERLYGTLTGKEPLFDNTVFDDRTRQLLRQSKIPVGIVIDKDLNTVNEIVLPLFSLQDSFLLIYAQKLIYHSNVRVVILDAGGITMQHPEMKETIRSIEQVAPANIVLYQEKAISKELFESKDLMLISLDSWKSAVETQSVWLAYSPSVLILRP